MRNVANRFSTYSMAVAPRNTYFNNTLAFFGSGNQVVLTNYFMFSQRNWRGRRGAWQYVVCGFCYCIHFFWADNFLSFFLSFFSFRINSFSGFSLDFFSFAFDFHFLDMTTSTTTTTVATTTTSPLKRSFNISDIKINMRTHVGCCLNGTIEASRLQFSPAKSYQRRQLLVAPFRRETIIYFHTVNVTRYNNKTKQKVKRCDDDAFGVGGEWSCTHGAMLRPSFSTSPSSGPVCLVLVFHTQTHTHGITKRANYRRNDVDDGVFELDLFWILNANATQHLTLWDAIWARKRSQTHSLT